MTSENVTMRQRSQLFISLAGGPALRVVEERIDGPEFTYARSLGAVMPDPNWVGIDEYGHEHRWASTGRSDGGKPEALPSLNRSFRRIECDGTCPHWDCGGYDETVWTCVLCGDEVEPGYKPDYQARTSGIPIQVGLARYEFLVEGDSLLPADGRLTFPTAPVPAMLVDGTHTVPAEAFLNDVEWSSEHPPRRWVELRFAPGALAGVAVQED